MVLLTISAFLQFPLEHGLPGSVRFLSSDTQIYRPQITSLQEQLKMLS